MRWSVRNAHAVLLAAVLLCSAVGSAAAAPAMTGEQAQMEAASAPAFVVALAEDGSAEVTVTYTFDLTEDARQAAFEELRDNETATATFEDRFRQQLQGVASDAGNATGREMTITDVDVAFETDGETGIVELTATWEGLAATGDGLTVTEPFASGFEPDRTFIVTVPDGYAADSVSPEPDRRDGGQLAWDAGSELSGFELTATGDTSTDSSDGESGNGEDGTSADGGDDTSGDDASAGESGPGFGPVVAVLAVLAVAGLAARRR